MTKPVALSHHSLLVNQTGEGCFQLDSPVWLPVLVRAHQEVRDSLKREEKHFLLPKPPSYFEKLLAGQGGTIFASFNGAGVLVGFCACLHRSGFAEAKATKALTFPDTDGRLSGLCEGAVVGAIQSFCVRPREQGRAYAQDILNTAQAWFWKEAKAITTPAHSSQLGAQLFAQVALDNACSLIKFMRKGYILEATWREPVDGKMRDKALLRYATKEERESLLKNGLISFSGDPKTKILPTQFKKHLGAGMSIVMAPFVSGSSKQVPRFVGVALG